MAAQSNFRLRDIHDRRDRACIGTDTELFFVGGDDPKSRTRTKALPPLPDRRRLPGLRPHPRRRRHLGRHHPTRTRGDPGGQADHRRGAGQRRRLGRAQPTSLPQTVPGKNHHRTARSHRGPNRPFTHRSVT